LDDTWAGGDGKDNDVIAAGESSSQQATSLHPSSVAPPQSPAAVAVATTIAAATSTESVTSEPEPEPEPKPEPLTPRVLPSLEEIKASAPTALEAIAAAAAARQAVHDQSSPLLWANSRTSDRNREEDGTRRQGSDGDEKGDEEDGDVPFRGDALEDAAFFVGWRVVNARTGDVIGDVKHALGVAGGEVVAQMGAEDGDDEDEDDAERADGDFFFPPGVGSSSGDDRDGGAGRDADDGGWEVIYEGEEGAAGVGGDGLGGECWGEYSDHTGDDARYIYGSGSGSGSFDDHRGGGEGGSGSVSGSGSGSFDGGSPPMSFLLRVRGMREVAGAGGATNLTPVVHLVPLVPALFPRWNRATRTLVMDPPKGLLDLGLRQSEIRALRKDLLPYCSRVNATELGMPQRRSLVRAGRGDLAARVTALGDWASVSVMLTLVSRRKPDG
jgi:hypothetical protein